jgi:hypothetical protein
VIVALVVLGGSIALAGAAWLWARPQRGLLLLAALLPFGGLLVLVPRAGVLSGWKEALSLLCALAALTSPHRARAGQPRRWPSWVIPFAGLLVLGAASVLTSDRSLGVLGFKIMFFYSMLAAAIWRCPFDARERDRFVSILMATGFVTAVFGIVQQVLGGDRLAALGWDWNTTLRTSGGRLRSISTFALPFPFAFYMVLVLVIGLSVALAEPGRLRNRLFLYASPVLFVGMVTAIVRGAIIGLAFGLAYLAVTRHKVLLHGAALALVGLLFLPASFTKVFTSSSSLTERQAGWSKTVGRIVSEPFGGGIGSVGAAAEKNFVDPPEALGSTPLPGPGRPYHPDNQFVAVGLQLGVFGLWLFVLVLRGALRDGHRAAVHLMGPDSALAAGIVASIVAAIASAMVATYWEIFPLDAYFWLLLGVTSSLPIESSTTRSLYVPVAAGSRPTSAISSVPSRA